MSMGQGAHGGGGGGRGSRVSGGDFEKQRELNKQAPNLDFSSGA